MATIEGNLMNLTYLLGKINYVAKRIPIGLHNHLLRFHCSKYETAAKENFKDNFSFLLKSENYSALMIF